MLQWRTGRWFNLVAQLHTTALPSFFSISHSLTNTINFQSIRHCLYDFTSIIAGVCEKYLLLFFSHACEICFNIINVSTWALIVYAKHTVRFFHSFSNLSSIKIYLILSILKFKTVMWCEMWSNLTNSMGLHTPDRWLDKNHFNRIFIGN